MIRISLHNVHLNLYHSRGFLAQSMQLLHFFFMFNNILLWQTTEVLEVSHFYFRHYFWSKYKAEKVATITWELSGLHPHIWCKRKWKQQGHSRLLGFSRVPTVYLKCLHVYFSPRTIVSNAISKPNKILLLSPFSPLLRVSSIIVKLFSVMG